MFAIGGKREIPRCEGPPGADLCGLLSLDRGPERELSLALERRRFVAEASHDDHVAVQTEDVVAVERGLVVGAFNAFALGRQQLNKFFVDHRHSFAIPPELHYPPTMIGCPGYSST